MWKVKSRYIETNDNGTYQQGNIEKAIYYGEDYITSVETLARNPFIQKDDEKGIATVVDRGAIVLIAGKKELKELIAKHKDIIATYGRLRYFIKGDLIIVAGWDMKATYPDRVLISEIDTKNKMVNLIYEKELNYSTEIPFAFSEEKELYLVGEVYPFSPSDVCSWKKVKPNTLKVAKIENDIVEILELENSEETVEDIAIEMSKRFKTDFKVFVY